MHSAGRGRAITKLYDLGALRTSTDNIYNVNCQSIDQYRCRKKMNKYETLAKKVEYANRITQT